MGRKNWGEPKVVIERGIGDLDRRRDVIAMAAAVMMWIPFVAVGGHLVRVARCMAHGNFVHAHLSSRGNAYIWPLQHVRCRRRPQGEDYRHVSKDV